MKIYTLMENTSFSPEFAAEHGLSLYIETKKHKILFDIGQTEKFASNAEKLGIDLSQVDTAVLSHGHYDHGGGIRRFLELNDKAPVYLSRYAFGDYYHGEERYIGLDQSLKGNDRLIFTEDELEMDGELTFCSCNDKECAFPLDSAGLTEKTDGGFIPDVFLHEQYLVIREDGKKVVISGCSHKGILNIVNWLQPDVLVGGFHFMGQAVSMEGNPVLDRAAEVLMARDTLYYTGHCTGQEPFAYLKKRMGERLRYLAAGQSVTI